jgi:CRP/FNR family transcriptional regulator, cyclic AMP receptor protein
MIMNISISEAFALVEVFRQATPTSIHVLRACGTMRHIYKGEQLFLDKEPVNTIYIVVSGRVSLYKVNYHGEKKVIFILDEGKFINEVILQGIPASINCEAFENAQILCFDRMDFLRVMEGDFALTKGVLDSLSVKVKRLYRQLKNTSNSVHGDKRIVAKMWKLSRDYGVACEEGTQINMALSITYLANMLGSKRETVSRQLKVLVGQGLIQIQDGQIIIPDRDKLSIYFRLP